MTEPEARGWTTTQTLYVVIAVLAVSQAGLGALLPYLSADLDMNHTRESLHITGIAVGALIVGSFAEPIRRAIGRRTFLLLAQVSALIGVTLLATAPAWWLTALAMVMIGMGVTTALIFGQAILAARYGARGARKIGEFNAAHSLGPLTTALVLPLAAASIWGWRLFPTIQIAVLALVVIPLFLVTTRHDKLDALPTVSLASDRGGYRTRWIPLLVVVTIVVEWSLLYWTATMLVTVAGLSENEASLGMVGMWAAIVVGRLAGIRLITTLTPHGLLIASFAWSIAGVGALYLVGSLPMGIVACVIVGLGAASLYTALSAIVIGAHPNEPDAAMARASVYLALTSIVAPFTLGALADRIGLDIAYAIVPICAALGIAIVRLVLPKKAPTPPRDDVVDNL